MLAITGTGLLVWAIAVCLAISLAVWSVIGGLNHFRVWRMRQSGLDRCRWCGTQLVTLVDRMNFPVGFATVCSGCGRDQGSR
jgi:hypothetical protein